MKANEFFKSMGIDGVRRFVKHNNIRSEDMLNELKRLIESHNIIDKVGGLKKAKTKAKNKFKPVGRNLIQAIADVESCQ